MVEIESVHVYSGEEWLAMPSEIQQYARDRLNDCVQLYAQTLGLQLHDEYATKVDVDEIGRKVRVRCIHFAVAFELDFRRNVLGLQDD